MTVGRLHNSATATHSYIIFLVCHSSMGPFSCNHPLIPPHAHTHTHTHTHTQTHKLLLCLNSGSASFEGPDLWGLRRRVLRSIVAAHPPKRGKRRPRLWAVSGGAFELGQPLRRCDVISLQMLLRRMQTMNWDTTTVWLRWGSDCWWLVGSGGQNKSNKKRLYWWDEKMLQICGECVCVCVCWRAATVQLREYRTPQPSLWMW